ncbi:helix-turn-helix domain-containing protein [Mesorhizobium sp. L103C105A0]|uniref:helix-turn-helix domain-containing protein n=1 Tax=Mesorhizobium sp. L103C105A0 TaxID=1287074 RepID=UPI0003FDC374|nr:helix-turn-helix domain-containing protein [Mesorhizobium sp. L103C105A0]
MSSEPTIRRGPRTTNYTTVPNHVFEDQRLSMEARWLLGYLLSKPDNWKVVIGDIRNKGGCGRGKAQRMVSELVELGYAVREQPRADGRFAPLSLVIFDEPRSKRGDETSESVAFLPQPEKRSTANPSTENAALVKTDPKAITDYQKRERSRDDKGECEPQADDPAGFKARVTHLAESLNWPHWAKSPLDWTVACFAELSDTERAEAEAKASAYLAHCGRKALALGTYFKDRKWKHLRTSALSVAKGSSVLMAQPFGSIWCAIRLCWLLLPPQQLPKPRSFLGKLMADDGAAGHRERLAYQARHGWPMVNRMDVQADNGNGTPVPADIPMLEVVGSSLEQVRPGTPLWAAWEAEHQRRGWPWLSSQGDQPVAYFPAGGPVRLKAFEEAVKGKHEHSARWAGG